MEMQSDEIIPIPDASGGEQLQQLTTAFTDEEVGSTVGWEGANDQISGHDATRNIDLPRFLSRPVRIANFTWLESDAVGTIRSFYPWQLYFNDASIKYKLNNFAFIQCDLHVKVLINASPFYYGAMICNYQPLHALTPSTIQNDTATRWFIPQSQRPHIWISPQENKAGTLKLPFFYHKNFIDVQTSQDTQDMGQLNFINYTVLDSANGISGAGVSIQVFAWCENVKLSGPSVGLAMQSDEYGSGVVSAPATAIANGARWFESIPVIGRFATATRIGASAVSAVASLFGWTNVPVIEDTRPYRPSAFPQLATTTIGFPAEKLTIDPKNELTVDPSVLGMDTLDEMTISSIVQRESYITTATWTTANNVDDILFSSLVTPVLLDTDAATNAKVYFIPMSWLTPMFKHWRGDIIFRFRFVASPFHKGRVRISYDPSGYAGANIINTTASYNTVLTHIVDLGSENDVELRIPYQQSTSYQQVQNSFTSANWSTSASPSFIRNKAFDNGTIVLRVQTALTAPVGTSIVPIMVFARAAENFEFANPNNQPLTLSTFPPQADEIVDNPSSTVLGTGVPIVHPDRNLINFGEQIKSMRQLLRRQCFSFVSVPVTGLGTEWHYLYQERLTRWPPAYGYDPTGIHSAVGIVNTLANFPFNFATVNPFNYFTGAFVAMRGSMQLTLNTDANDSIAHVKVVRTPDVGGAVGLTTTTSVALGTASACARFYALNSKNGAAGMALTSQITNAGLTVQFPNYTRYRFQSTRLNNHTAALQADGSDIDAAQLEFSFTPAGATAGQNNKTNSGCKIWHYYGIGTDFNVHFFLNVPTYWVYSVLPTAN
jgi:hypothetical protein